MSSLELKEFDPTSLASVYAVDKSKKVWLAESKLKPEISIAPAEQNTKLEEIHLAYDFNVEQYTIMPQVKAQEAQRLLYALVSPSGYGKSIFAATLAKLWLKYNEKDSLIILVKPEEDHAYSQINEDYILYFTPEELYMMHLDHESKGTKLYDKFKSGTNARRLWIFDDCEIITNDHLKKFLQDFQILLMQNGRKNLYDMIVILHSLASSNTPKLLRAVCLQASHIWCTKAGLKSANNEYALEKKFFVNKKILKKVSEMDTRYFTLNRNMPQSIITEYNVFLY